MFKQGKTNIKYILIVVILAAIVAGGILWWMEKEGSKIPEIMVTEKEKPYIKVIYPNGEEELKIGRTYTIKWESSGVGFVNIYLRDWKISSECYLNEEPILATLGSYTVKLDKFKCMGGTGKVSPEPIRLEESEKYTINISKTPHEPYKEIADESDNYFSIIEDETANWKTYRNEEYGFEVKYPKEYSFSEKPKELLMKDYSPYYPYSYEKNLISDTMFCYDRGGNLPSEERVSCDVRILVYQNPKNLSVRDFFEETESIIGFEIQTEKDIVSGNQINAKKFIFGKGHSSKEIIAVEKEEKIIAITGPLDTTTGLFISVLEYSKDFDSADTLEQAFLSTFKFLE